MILSLIQLFIQAAKILANLIVMGGGILTRAFVQAYRQALASEFLILSGQKKISSDLLCLCMYLIKVSLMIGSKLFLIDCYYGTSRGEYDRKWMKLIWICTKKEAGGVIK